MSQYSPSTASITGRPAPDLWSPFRAWTSLPIAGSAEGKIPPTRCDVSDRQSILLLAIVCRTDPVGSMLTVPCVLWTPHPTVIALHLAQVRTSRHCEDISIPSLSGRAITQAHQSPRMRYPVSARHCSRSGWRNVTNTIPIVHLSVYDFDSWKPCSTSGWTIWTRYRRPEQDTLIVSLLPANRNRMP